MIEQITEKAFFLRNEFIPALQKIDVNTPAKWGKMNVMQMIEHMADFVRLASGKAEATILTDAEKIPAMQNFLRSDKPFRENTPNILLPDSPLPPKHTAKEAAIDELQEEVMHFFDIYEKEEGKTCANPFFGDLDYEHQVQLLHKHSTHHLRQFGVAV